MLLKCVQMTGITALTSRCYEEEMVEMLVRDQFTGGRRGRRGGREESELPVYTGHGMDLMAADCGAQ